MKLSPYLNFDGNAEEAFKFYQSVFSGELSGFQRFGEVPGYGDTLPEEEKNRVMHVQLKIGDSALMASDISPSMGHKLVHGNNNYITLELSDKSEADRIFSGLSSGGKVEMPMQDMFWGAYYGSCMDQFGVQWMINCVPNS